MIGPATFSDDDAKALLDELSAQFVFNYADNDVEIELRSLSRRYGVDKRVFNDLAKDQQNRAGYRKLKLETERFRALLDSGDYEDLDSDLYWAALHKNSGEPHDDIPVIGGPKHQQSRAYLADLNYLLSLLESAAELGTTQFAPAKGRKRNYALENAVRRIAYVWSELLERPFTIDYHDGTGLTPAFSFVSVIFEKLDPEISENNIVTAMRTVVSEKSS